ncbi:MAG: DUF4129 domain-containing transglutaminase family protein, partial [Parahaliea sp.]
PTVVGEALRYSVLMMPTQQRWLYSLRYGESTDAGILQTPDFRLYRPVEIQEQYHYRVSSWPATALEAQLSSWRRTQELQLPEAGNPRSRELARRLRETSGSDAGFVDTVLARFREQSFVYTLQPPLLGEDDVDEFLVQTRRGFCEHYAAAFVLLLRAGGVPARVVAGYQGGEINPVNRTVIVHQFDAHAWAEVWLAGEGWRRVDPTAAVSPARIEQGLEQALAREGSFLTDSPLSPLRYRGISWLNNLRLHYDALTYRWQSWVLGFNSDTQFDLLQRYLGELSTRKFMLLLLGSGALVLVPLGLWLRRRCARETLDPLDRNYLAFCARLAALGVPRRAGEAPGDFAERVCARLPELGPVVREVTAIYTTWAYAGGADEGVATAGEQAQRRLRQLTGGLPRGRASSTNEQ